MSIPGLKTYGATNPVPVELHHEKLGPRVPLMSNSPSQWFAASGMMLRAEVGSTAYGTNIPGVSDTDEMGVAVEAKVTTLGLKSWDNYRFRTAEVGGPELPPGESAPSRPGDLDLTVYSLRRFVSLVCAGNPSLLALLFIPEGMVRFANDFGRELRANADKFVSKKAYKPFRGHMHQERRRILASKTPAKSGMHALRLGMQGVEILERGVLSIPPRKRELDTLKRARRGAWTNEEILARIDVLEAQLDAALAKSPLPDEPNWNWINTWLGDVHLRHWREN